MASISRPYWLSLEAVPPDVAAGCAGGGDGDAVLDGDLVGVGAHGHIRGLAGVGEADLDLLPADHDRPAHRHPAFDDQRLGQPWRVGGSGRAPRSRARVTSGTGQVMVRVSTPPDTTWATGPSSRKVIRCRASGEPTLSW